MSSFADQTGFRGVAVPFPDAAEAWFWTMASLTARRDGLRRGAGSSTLRPCDPDDVVGCVDKLFRARSIDPRHARVLRVWGERRMAPSHHAGARAADQELWEQALRRLDGPLRRKGIIA